MLRIVADANVLVSAAIESRGPSAQIVQLAQQGAIELVVSEKLIDEVADVLARKRLRKRISEETANDYVDAITLVGQWTDDRPEPHVPLVCPDPDDNYLIALYQDADAHMLVTGDKGVQSVQYPNVYIYSPAGALDTIAYHRESGDKFVPGNFEQFKLSAEGDGNLALIKVFAVFLGAVFEPGPNVIEELRSVTVPIAAAQFIATIPPLQAMLAGRTPLNRLHYASPEVAHLPLPRGSGGGNRRATADFRLPPDTIFATLLRCPDIDDPPGLDFDHWRILAIGPPVRPEDIPPGLGRAL